MACSASCGSDREMMDSLIEAAVDKALAEGKVQSGLKDCEGGNLAKDAKVLLCSALADAVNAEIKAGNIDVVKSVELADGKLKVTDGAGKVVEKPLPGVKDVAIEGGELVVSPFDGDAKKLALPGLKTVAVKDGKLVVTPLSGEKEETTLPFVHELNFDNSTLTLSWKEGDVAHSEKLPFLQAAATEKALVVTLPNGDVVEVPRTGVALTGDDFDETIEKGANKPGKYGVHLNPKGGIERTIDGLAIKTGNGIRINENGALEAGISEVVTKLPITGNGTAANPITANFNGRDFIVNPVNGEISLKQVQTDQVKDLNKAVPVMGFSSFFGYINKVKGDYVVGVVPDIKSTSEAQTATSQVSELKDGEEYDFNGWQIASPVQVDQYITGVDGIVWHRTNDGGMNADGTLKNPGDWGNWRREENVSVSMVQVDALQKSHDALEKRVAALEAFIKGFIPLKDATGTQTLGLLKQTINASPQ